MKIQLLSDVHWEFLSKEQDIPDIEETDSDVVVLAGDIHTGVNGIMWAARQQKRLDKPIIYVTGNHEYYNYDFYELNKALKQCAKEHNIHLLQNNSVVIDEVRFLGATLWTSFGEHHSGLMTIAHNNINDYRFITAHKWWQTQRGHKIAEKWFYDAYDKKEHKNKFLPHIAYDEHEKSIRWLTKQLQTSFDGKTVVITHHAPTYQSLKPLMDISYLTTPEAWVPYAKDRLGVYRVAGYASDLSQLFSQYHHEIDIWMHGHTHCQLDYLHKGIRVVANPRGYPKGKSDEFSNHLFSMMFKTNRPEKIDYDPTEGDVTNFNPQACYDLDDGLYPTLLPQLKDYYQQWKILMDETKTLKNYISHQDSMVCKLAVFKLEHLAKSFNKISQKIAVLALSNLNPQVDYQLDNDILNRSYLLDGQYSIPVPIFVNEYYLKGIISENKPFNFYEEVINKMVDVSNFLPEWIESSFS